MSTPIIIDDQGTVCDLCGANRHVVLYDRGRDTDNLKNVVCCSCGYVFVSGSRNQVSIGEQYTSGSFSIEARSGPAPTREKIAQSEFTSLTRYRLLRSIVPEVLRSNPKVLEIGCGLGSFLRLIQGAGGNVEGVEPDPTYAKLGSEYYQLPISADLYEHFPAVDNSYDLIASFHVIEHLPSPTAFVQWVVNKLKLGGIVYLECPCIDRPYGGNLDQFFWSVHLQSFSVNTLSGLLAKFGFRIRKTGFASDFVWVVAEKTSTVDLPKLPYDVPDDVIRRTRNWQAWYRRGKTSRFARTIRTVYFNGKKAIANPRKAWHRLAQRIQKSINAVRVSIVRRHGGYINHFGIHVPDNAGDTLLFVLVRDAIGHGTHPVWSLVDLHRVVSKEDINRYNQESRGLVVGGGGLFLTDTNPNQVTGWQWPCRPDLLRELTVPLIAFAVGYNRFRGQDEFNEQFTESVRVFVRQCAFVGLRNSGSIRALSKYLPAELAAKLVYQPCPTTVLNRLHPKLCQRTESRDRKILALNMAFDRHWLRFGGQCHNILSAIAAVMKVAQQDGWIIRLALHTPLDATIIPWLHRENVEFEEWNLNGVSATTVVRFYANTDLTIGMRGHAQMVPYGVGNPIVSLISHDKLAWFLEDIQRPEWGIEITDPQLESRLNTVIADVKRNTDQYRKSVIATQDRLWAITEANIAKLQTLLKLR